jgi:ADP-ribose pyrophosphatase YjhB (NUDIX family)
VSAVQRRVVRGVHLGLLHVFARLPVRLRRLVARLLGVGYTVGALVLVEDPDSSRVLLIQPSYRQGWGLPGGMLRRSEEPATAAARELREELGVVVGGLHGGAVVFDVAARRIDVVYNGRIEAGAEPRAVSAEVRALGWFTMGDLPPLLPEAESALAALDGRGERFLVLPAERESGWLT